MRKNKMMRAASALLVAVLLTTSTISGTFAKYVTTASGSDTARVAKWGVEVVGMESTMFKGNYDDTVVTSVVSEKLVAPGTKNETGVTFGITGTPEVSVNVKFEVTAAAGTGEPVDVFLKAQNGTYINWTQAPYDTKFDLTEDYHPVKFTLTDTKGTVVTTDDVIIKDALGDELKDVTLADIESYLESSNVSKNYEPNTPLAEILGGTSGIYTLTWKWDYTDAVLDGEITLNDKADTLLGQIISGKDDTPYGDENVSTGINFAIKVTVTQVD